MKKIYISISNLPNVKQVVFKDLIIINTAYTNKLFERNDVNGE